jgi:long-chain acyl-CoA synthetase
MNIWNEVLDAVRFRPDHPAIRFGGETTTYAELVTRVEQQAAAFARRGIVTGDRVCLFLPNTPDFAVAYYALVRLGAVAVSVNIMCKAEEVRHIVNDAGAAAIVVMSDQIGELPQRQLVPTLRDVVVGLASVETLSEVPAVVDLLRDAPAAILYTSGTTGKAKGATLSHGNVVSNAHAAKHVTGLRRDDVTLCFLPLFHCFGQNVLLNATLFAGATVALERRFSPDTLLACAARERFTMLFAVPTAYIALLADAHASALLGSVRYSFSAAAILPTHVEEAWHAATGMHIHEGYGLTETSPFASYNHAWRWKAGSVGAPLENVEMCVQDENGRMLASGELGELCIRGPNVMLGYWGRPDETALAIRDGWFHSGDIGYRDGDGDYFIVDRVKDMINVGGFKVWPREVEEVLFTHEQVQEAAVVGIPDDYSGEAVKAFLVAKAGVLIDEPAVIAFCQTRLSTYKVPKHVEVVALIPKGATGKMLKKDLRPR